MKRILMLLISVVMLASCTDVPEDVKSRTEQKSEGRDFGNITICCEPMPAGADKYYILTSPSAQAAVADDNDAKMLCDAANAVFGIELDPGTAYNMDPENKNGYAVENDQCFCEIGHNGGFMLGASVIAPPEGFKDPSDVSYEFIRYTPESYPSDKLTMLDGKQMTIDDAIGISNENIKKLEDIGMFDKSEILSLSGIYTADTGFGTELFLTYDQVHYGLPLDDAGFIAPMATEDNEAGSSMRSGHLTVLFLNTQMPDMIRNHWDLRFEKSEELTEIIPFEDACQRLSEALADNMRITVNEAALKYCCYYTAGDDVNVYRPMWTFLLKEQTKRFGMITLRPTITAYVDAVNGDVYYSDFEQRICQVSKSGSDGSSRISVNTESEQETSSDTTQPESKADIKIDVVVKSYNNNTLTFEYDGKEYSLKMSKSLFSEDEGFGAFEKTLSEKIIERKSSDGVKAVLTVDEELTAINSCDVISQNGKRYKGLDPKDYPDEDISYSFRRTEGSGCEIYNKYETLTFDLNDLPIGSRLDYPAELPEVNFISYEFTDGELMLISFSEPEGKATVNEDKLFTERTAFLAAVQSVSDGRAEILLNDGKTVCSVPTYFNNGKIKAGAKVIVMLAEDTTLFGSGEHKEYNYAVIYADTAVYDIENRSFENDAYGVFRTNGSRTLRFVSISEAENRQ